MVQERQDLSRAIAAFARVGVLSASPLAAGLAAGATPLPADTFATPRPELRFDLLVQPEAAFAATLANLLASCRAALVARSSVTSAVRERCLAEGPAGLALLRGDLDLPLIRIDDYPTGVRPIPGDLEPLHEVLRELEIRELPYVLGIVPALLTEPMFEHLTRLRCMIPAQHGYDHGYPRMSAKLIRSGDPLNARGTVGGFNEFRLQWYGRILKKLGAGQALLQRRLGRAVTTYIPPCNQCDARTARALRALGFTLCLADRPVPRGYVPVLRSDFYGRSGRGEQSVLAPACEVICLHATWELDVRRAGDRDALPELLAQVTRLAADKRALVQQLARAVREDAS